MLHKCITLGKTLLEEERKIGPKGQVVIPRTMRKALKIEPGSKVLFRLEDDKLIVKKPAFDAVAVFRRIAKEINYNKKVDPHAYEEELDERFKRALSGR
jgi:AbrB family looped-hinge helix DNA binding protein